MQQHQVKLHGIYTVRIGKSKSPIPVQVYRVSVDRDLRGDEIGTTYFVSRLDRSYQATTLNFFARELNEVTELTSFTDAAIKLGWTVQEALKHNATLPENGEPRLRQLYEDLSAHEHERDTLRSDFAAHFPSIGRVLHPVNQVLCSLNWSREHADSPAPAVRESLDCQIKTLDGVRDQAKAALKELEANKAKFQALIQDIDEAVRSIEAVRPEA
jgi:hypothetical protein